MEITVLGSGGNTPIPLPTCMCDVCEEAREQGEPYARRGNSLFIQDENILIDVPELVWYSLNREKIENVDYIFLSHFHADHTFGLRVVQALGLEEPPFKDFIGEKTTLVMSSKTYEQVLEGNESFGAVAEHFAEIETLDDGESIQIGDLDITWLGAEIEEGGEKEMFGFLVEEGEKRVLITPDENRHFDTEKLPGLDLWIKETGYFTKDPSGNPIVTEAAEGGVLSHEMSFEESLEQVRDVEPDRTVFTEIEEVFKRGYDDYNELEEEHSELGIEFAYDGMEIHV